MLLKKYNFAVLDDGLQDLNAKKDLNIVCFHSSQKIGNGFVILGPLRRALMNYKNVKLL